MALSLLDVCLFNGPALPEPFVQFELEKELSKLGLLSKTSGDEGKKLQAAWEVYRRHLRELAARGGPLRVRHCVVDPIAPLLGLEQPQSAGDVTTREGQEDGGHLLKTADGTSHLRVWTTEFDEDLDAPARRGAAYRFSHLRIAQRVLLTTGERIGLLTNGTQLRVLLADPARPDSEIVIPIESAWKRSREVPDSFRLVLALCQPKGIQSLADLVEKARLQQVRVTKELRRQARRAVEQFIQEVLDHPDNGARFDELPDKQQLAKDLWHEGLVLVYRLLFILKLETTDDGARSFRFTSSSLWRNTFSPSLALAPRVRDLLDHSEDTGNFLESGLRALFQMFTGGLECSELHVAPLGGSLFGPEAAPLLDGLHWGDRAVALLLDQLLWTESKAGQQRVHYGSLDVEDLGRVYEALLELEAGLSTERLCRLRRQKLEVVVPVAQGEKYRTKTAPSDSGGDEEDEGADADADAEEPASGMKTKVEWIEEIQPQRFYLRVGLGRKASGSYYTPHSFVRFLVQETLAPLVAERSPHHDPDPLAILKLKVLDPAMGSGHFLVEACRFLGEKLYEACRLCDERASPEEIRAENALDDAGRTDALAEATKYRRRILDLPDPNDEIVQYLPSRAPEGGESGLSQKKALALCRRLVAVHCLYGVDKNRLAVELAKLALWIESHAEGLPLTFMDHRLVEGDSLAGPSLAHILTYPQSGEPIEGLFADNLKDRLTSALAEAISYISELGQSVGTTLSETEAKRTSKANLDKALRPFNLASSFWAGRVIAGGAIGSDYVELLRGLLTGERTTDELSHPDAISFSFVFPEVFFPTGNIECASGFDAILGNPPWDAIQFKSKEFLASFDLDVLNAPTQRERIAIERHLLNDDEVRAAFEYHKNVFEGKKRLNDRFFAFQKIYIDGDLAGRQLDEFRVFLERYTQLLKPGGRVGVVVPSAFHANEGASGIRRLYLERMRIHFCYSFENRSKLFEIDSRFKFALLVAEAGNSTSEFQCAFYLQDDQWLFSAQRIGVLNYSRDFISRTGGRYLNFVEARSQEDVSILNTLYANSQTVESFQERVSIHLQGPPAALHMSHESGRFDASRYVGDVRQTDRRMNVREDPLLVFEGKHIWHYDDCWGAPPRYVVPIAKVRDLPDHIRRSHHYQMAVRAVASSTNERTVVACLLPLGALAGHSLLIDASAGKGKYSDALSLIAVFNTLTFDWLARQQVAANVTLFVLRGLPLPDISRLNDFMVHSAARLHCNHAGYSVLWSSIFGEEWREVGPPTSWPAMPISSTKWLLRAAIDALVAKAYGLNREQYASVLASFKHEEYVGLDELSLTAFDELCQLGEDGFQEKYDPYRGLPLKNTQPVVTSGGGEGRTRDSDEFALTSPSSRKGRRKK